ADVRGEAAEQRENREDGRAEEENAPPPEHIREPAAGHDQHAEDQRVAVDDPLHLVDADAELLLERRQRHAHRREVVRDDQRSHPRGRARDRRSAEPISLRCHGSLPYRRSCHSICCMPKASSAGILLYRIRTGALEVFLVHPGGPYWRDKDAGAWSIPKGEIEGGADPLATARREFREETGQDV